jgi:hypothetical protein
MCVECDTGGIPRGNTLYFRFWQFRLQLSYSPYLFLKHSSL